jgi:Mrp family chromosome partitioning ATPase
MPGAYGRVLGSIGRVIAVTSCKGGVGKSTVSLELARRLAARGHRVGIFDADVHGPSLPAQLPAAVSVRGVTPAADGWSMMPLLHEGLSLMSFGWLGVWGTGEEVD